MKKQTNKKQWLTTGIKKSCKNKRLLKLLKSDTNSDILNNYYKQYEKLLKKTVQKSKKISYAHTIKKSNNITKTMWHIVKEKTNKLPKKNKQNIKLSINKTIIEDPKTIANFFNDYFISVGAEDTTTSDGSTRVRAAGRPVLTPIFNSLYLEPVTEKEVHQIICNLKTKHSFGHDELPPALVKKCADELSKPLTFLINQSFSQGKVPDSLKLSIIKPIYKKEKKPNAIIIVQLHFCLPSLK